MFGTNAFDFDPANNDYINLGYNDQIDLTKKNEYTITAWARLEATDADRSAIAQGSGDVGLGYDVGNNTWYHFALDSGGTYAYGWWPENGVTANEWVHLAGTFNGTHVAVYVNGTKSDTNDPIDDVQDTSQEISIGNNGYGSSGDRYWPGQIDEARIYDRALSDSEIEQLYLYGKDQVFNGNYSRTVDNNRVATWDDLYVDVATDTADTPVDAVFEAVDSSGTVQDSQVISLSQTAQNYSLTVQDSEDGRVTFNGTSTNTNESWEINEFDVYHTEATGDDTLSETLSAGNTAGGYDIDMNGNRILNAANSGIRFISGVISDDMASGEQVAQIHGMSNRSVIWEVTPDGGKAENVHVDAQGFVYAGTSGDTVYKYDRDGNQEWSNGIGTTVFGLDVSPAGYVYAGDSTDDVHKIAPNGSDVWTEDLTDYHEDVRLRVGPEGNIYTISEDDGWVTKRDADGNKIWDYNATSSGPAWRLDVDRQGNVYIGTEENKLLKLDKNGKSVWNFTTPTERVAGVATDDTYVYVGSYDTNVYKLDASDGSQVSDGDWPYSHDDNIYAVEVDTAGRVYVGDKVSSDYKFNVVDPDGNELWRYERTGTGPVTDIEADGRGHVYVSWQDGVVQKIHGGAYASYDGYDGVDVKTLGQ
jgi:hypothetical protein